MVTHSGTHFADPLHMDRVDVRRLVLAVERRAVAREGQSTLRRLGLAPAVVSATDVLTSLAPADPALDQPINEWPEPLLWSGTW